MREELEVGFVAVSAGPCQDYNILDTRFIACSEVTSNAVKVSFGFDTCTSTNSAWDIGPNWPLATSQLYTEVLAPNCNPDADCSYWESGFSLD